jgi:hypothetical protein
MTIPHEIIRKTLAVCITLLLRNDRYVNYLATVTGASSGGGPLLGPIACSSRDQGRKVGGLARRERAYRRIMILHRTGYCALALLLISCRGFASAPLPPSTSGADAPSSAGSSPSKIRECPIPGKTYTQWRASTTLRPLFQADGSGDRRVTGKWFVSFKLPLAKMRNIPRFVGSLVACGEANEPLGRFIHAETRPSSEICAWAPQPSKGPTVTPPPSTTCDVGLLYRWTIKTPKIVKHQFNYDLVIFTPTKPTMGYKPMYGALIQVNRHG